NSILSPNAEPADPVTPADFTLLGMSGVTDFNLDDLLSVLQGPEPADGETRQPIDQYLDIREAVADYLNQMPEPRSLSIELEETPPGALQGGPLPLADTEVTITGSLDVAVDPAGGRYLVYGRMDGAVGPGVSDEDGWQALNGPDQPIGVSWVGNHFTWTGAAVEQGTGKAVQFKVVDTQDPDRDINMLRQAYRYYNPALFQEFEGPALQVPGVNENDSIPADPIPADAIRLKVDISSDDILANTGAVRLMLVPNGDQNPREIPSVFHAQTGSLIPLYALPEGSWNLSYQLVDFAGTASQQSEAVSLTISSPQNVLSENDPFGHNVEAGILLDAISRDRLSIRGDSNDLTLDATGDRIDAIRELNSDIMLTEGGAMRAETQMDLVGAQSADVSDLNLAQQDLLDRFGHSAFDAFEATDLVRFRLYPQTMVDRGEVEPEAQNDFANRVREAYTGVRHQVDVHIEDSAYAVDEFEARYYKVYPDGTVEHFDWDPVSQTGARAQDTDGDGFYDLFTLFIREGGRGDVDGVADGVVLDPGFGVFYRPKVEVPPPSTPGDETGSGGLGASGPSARPGSSGSDNDQYYRETDNEKPSLLINKSVNESTSSIGRRTTDGDFNAWLRPNDVDRNASRLDAAVYRPMTDASNPTSQRMAVGLQQSFGEAGPLRSMDARSARMDGLIRAISEPTSVERSPLWSPQASAFELTSTRGFGVVVMPLEEPGLAVLRGHPDLSINAGERYVDVINPDAFVHSEADAQILLTMDLPNGEALPDWVQFNARTGELMIEPPLDAPAKFLLRVTAVDDQGNERSFIIRLSLLGTFSRSDVAMSLPERLRGAR
ncbi:MAG: hypothetical protein RI529_01510, partial [Spiribacter sp.]|nr:hypothetical protein [Spiribacter sp.]